MNRDYTKAKEIISISPYDEIELEEIRERRLYINSVIDEEIISGIAFYILKYNREDMGKKAEDRKPIILYINSPGGSVFAASTIVSMLRRFKQQTKSKIHSYIDGLCASAATYLLMVADDVNIYQNSIMMIHKPMGLAWGNANELQREIDVLNTIENDMMIPMYMNKSKISEEEIKQLVNDETWFNGNENDELYIGNYFEVNYLEDVKEVVACTSQELFKNYKHVPNKLKEQPKVANEDEKEKEEEVSNVQKPDYSAFEEVIKTLRKGD